MTVVVFYHHCFIFTAGEKNMDTMNLITCKNLSFAYDGMIAVKNLNFTVQQKDYLCIVGENGAGKSTLIKGLLRLKKPSGGTLHMENGLLAKEIGYLPQQTTAQKDFPATVYEVVLSGCLNRLGIKPFYTKKEKVFAEKNMEIMGIAALKNHCYRELSGGQQQRVLLARALCATKKLLLLDEPTAGLDPVATHELYALVQKINADLGITVIMVSHDIQAAIVYAKHILHLHHAPLFFGTTESYKHSSVGRRFLGGVSDV